MPKVGNWPHLMIDGYRCKSEKLDNVNLIYKFLEALPSKLNMHILTKPHVIRNDTETDYGVTGIVLIAESHISIHTFPKEGYFTMDIYSCKPFDTQETLDYTVAFFESNEFDYQIAYRGREDIPKEEKEIII